MASEAAPPLLGLDRALKPGAALSPSSAVPCSPPAPGPVDLPPWEPSPQHPASPGNPSVYSAFSNPLLVTGNGSGTGKVIVKVKTEGGAAELCPPQTLDWIPSRAPCAVSEGPPLGYMAASDGKAVLPTQAAAGGQEGSLGFPPQAPPPVAQLAPIVPLEKAWPGLQETHGEGGPSLRELAHMSKGVYENFRRWQRYKALARQRLPQSPDTEALSCFLIPVLRSLARLKPTMTLEEGLPRAMQEWEHTSNFDRMTFYEMAEKFMEFEAEEELQMQKAQINGSQGQSPAAPLKLDPPGSLTPEACQPTVYIPKKAASKTRAPRRRQRRPQRPPVPEAPKEIPPEAVEEYIDIMEGLVGSPSDPTESSGRSEEEGQQDGGVYPDASLLSYVDELCSQEVFVSKVEAVIHPQFLADLLSPEQQRDPLALTEELEQEEGLTMAQLVQKRLSALEEEDSQAPPTCSGAQSDSSPSVSDEDEDGGGRPPPSSGPRGAAGGTVRPGKAAASGKQAREMPGGQERARSGPTGVPRDGSTPPPRVWEPQSGLAARQGAQPASGVEGRGSGEVTSQLPPQQEGHLGEGQSLGHCPRADGTLEALPVCWPEGPQPTRVPSVDPGLMESSAVQGQGLEQQILELQIGPQMEVCGEPFRGTVPLMMSQEGSSERMWREGGDPPMTQNYDQKPSPGVAGHPQRALSPGLWLTSEMDAVGLELPFQMEEVIDSFQDGVCIVEHPARESTNSFPLGGGETTALGKAGSAMIPLGGTDGRATVERMNGYSLSEPLMDSSLDLLPKDCRGQSLEPIQDPSDLWAGSCSPLLGGADVSPLEPPKDALLSACHDSLFIVGTPDAFLPQMPSQDSESRGNPFSPLLETAEHVSILDGSDYCGLQLRSSEDFNSYDFQVDRGRDSCLSKCDDLVLLQDNLEAYVPRTLNSPSHHSFGSTSPRWESREVLAFREISISETSNSLDGAKGGVEEEGGEDEQLSNFAYLLASKLSLSPRGRSLSAHPASGGHGIQTASRLSAEARGPSQLPCPATKPEGPGLAGGSAPPVKRSQAGVQLGAHGEKPLALGVAQPSPPRKRRGDSPAAGRRKKRRRSQV
ncbi:NUT family member 1 isoform 2-T2 [Thomomys bottae]